MSSNEINYEVGSYLYSLYQNNSEKSRNTLEENLNLFYVVLGMIVERFYPKEYLYLLNYLSLV